MGYINIVSKSCPSLFLAMLGLKKKEMYQSIGSAWLTMPEHLQKVLRKPINQLRLSEDEDWKGLQVLLAHLGTLITDPERLLSASKCSSALLEAHLMLFFFLLLIVNFMSSLWWWIGLAWEKFGLMLRFRLLMCLLNKGY